MNALSGRGVTVFDEFRDAFKKFNREKSGSTRKKTLLDKLCWAVLRMNQEQFLKATPLLDSFQEGESKNQLRLAFENAIEVAEGELQRLRGARTALGDAHQQKLFNEHPPSNGDARLRGLTHGIGGSADGFSLPRSDEHPHIERT